MIEINNKQVFSTDDRLIHLIGTDTYFKSGKGIVLPTETEMDFEEVDEVPPYTKSEYDAKVAELVRERYSESEEFAIQRKTLNVMLSPSAYDDTHAVDEYAAYNTYVEECKTRAKSPELYNNVTEYDKTSID